MKAFRFPQLQLGSPSTTALPPLKRVKCSLLDRTSAKLVPQKAHCWRGTREHLGTRAAVLPPPTPLCKRISQTFSLGGENQPTNQGAPESQERDLVFEKEKQESDQNLPAPLVETGLKTATDLSQQVLKSREVFLLEN